MNFRNIIRAYTNCIEAIENNLSVIFTAYNFFASLETTYDSTLLRSLPLTLHSPLYDRSSVQEKTKKLYIVTSHWRSHFIKPHYLATTILNLNPKYRGRLHEPKQINVRGHMLQCIKFFIQT